MSERASEELTRAGKSPTAIHNNCSGKHAGMLATAVYRGIDPTGYERPEHAVQEDIRRVLSEICGVPLDRHDMGIDGCSVPTFALPLGALATGFARLGSGKGLTGARKDAAERLVSACVASPALVAGEGRFDTVVMRGLGPKVFSKGGAEGVHCASVPAAGLGIAVKIDDGAKRGAEHVLAWLLAELVPGADRVLKSRLDGELRNWLGIKVGQIRPSPMLAAAAKSLSPAKG
jgi:L-asparaginase II